MNSSKIIWEFKDEYRWLSNFHPCKVTLDGLEFDTVEHAYQSAKSEDPEWKTLCAGRLKPGIIKREAHRFYLPPNWRKKVGIPLMTNLCTQKFHQEPFTTHLIITYPKILIEGNLWKDTFWGVYLRTNRGHNHLGKIIMTIRTQLRTVRGLIS